MPTFHPTFDPLTAMWFVEGAEAPTLAALLKLLPRRSKLEGYYPNGYKAVRIILREPRAAPIKSVFNVFIKHKNIPKPAAQPVVTSIANDSAILDDWAAGMSGEAIANKHNILTQRAVMKKIKKARDHGDPRAISHQKAFVTRPQKYNHDAILNLWAAGHTGPEIGRRLGLHASTTAAAIVAEYRHKGDPRALSRAPTRRPGANKWA